MAYDFDPRLSAEDCLALLQLKTHAGDVIVLHDNLKSFEKLKVVLPPYLDFCIEEGFEFKLL